jgi:pimeloyl-ACP methyl ester carboxylesterase
MFFDSDMGNFAGGATPSATGNGGLRDSFWILHCLARPHRPFRTRSALHRGRLARLAKDYARMSPTPDGFNILHQALEAMQKKEPNYTTKELAAIKVSKITIAEGDHEEFITRAHTDYLAATIPGARLIILPNVSHFAPWQDPTTFNKSILQFLHN